MPDEQAPRRIHVIGGPGSGKTTLARTLSRRLGIAHIDLDDVGYPPDVPHDWTLDDKLAAVSDIAKQDAWITEGIYLWWVDALFARAEIIVWLDIPWRVAAWRIASRHAKASLRGTNRYKGLRRLRAFLANARAYYTHPPVAPRSPDADAAVTRAATEEVVRQMWPEKVVRLESRQQVSAWLASMRIADTDS